MPDGSNECSVCRKPLEPNAGGGMNGVHFCTNTDCIEKAVKLALEPVANAMQETRG